LGTSSQVRGDVGRTFAVEAVLGGVLRVVQVQTTHVELFSHVGGVEARLVLMLWNFLQGAESKMTA
jgi:hypothetical protein